VRRNAGLRPAKTPNHGLFAVRCHSDHAVKTARSGQYPGSNYKYPRSQPRQWLRRSVGRLRTREVWRSFSRLRLITFTPIFALLGNSTPIMLNVKEFSSRLRE
jgi:hypothetical protein